MGEQASGAEPQEPPGGVQARRRPVAGRRHGLHQPLQLLPRANRGGHLRPQGLQIRVEQAVRQIFWPGQRIVIGHATAWLLLRQPRLGPESGTLPACRNGWFVIGLPVGAGVAANPVVDELQLKGAEDTEQLSLFALQQHRAAFFRPFKHAHRPLLFVNGAMLRGNRRLGQGKDLIGANKTAFSQRRAHGGTGFRR